jgi:hypothetical protein
MSTPGGFPVAEPAANDALPAGTLAIPRLRRLLHKYQLLLELSRGTPGRTEQRRDAMRTIAQRFPAALREWDEQPREEIERRHGLLTELVAHGEPLATAQTMFIATETWLRYSLDVHDCLRAVLQLRRYLSQQAGGRLPRGAAASDQAPEDRDSILARLATCQALVCDCEVPWLTVTPALLSAIAQPAAGRLTALAYQAVAERHGTSPATIKHALFGRPTAPR